MKKPVVDYRKLRLLNITSKEYRHLLLLTGWLVYFVMYFVTERFIPVSKCHVVHSVMDDLIPFNEYFVIFYVSWYLFMVLSLLYFMLYDINNFVRAQKLIIGMQIIAVITYIVWPSVQNLRPDHFEHANFCTWILGIIYSMDTPTGVCPSLHVGYTLAVLSAWFGVKDVKPWKKMSITAWGIMICISVCFVKQHSFTDVWAALTLYLFLEFLLFGRVIGLRNRKWGDRRDGTLIRNIDAMHYIMPLMYPNRCDNEAYMNTGIQKSSLTPFGARTTTTPAGKNIRSNLRPKKNLFEIVAAHGIPYAATASVGYLNDFMRKVEKAKRIKGAKYIHILAPCPTGWGVKTDETVEIAKEVVDCGLWYLAEYENGDFTLNHRPKEFSDVSAYLRRQSRFKHLTDEDIEIITRSRDKKWEFINQNFK